MGKSEHRTKGNIKAASSARAKDAFVSTGFIGFAAVSGGQSLENGASVDLILSVEEKEQNLDPALRLIFKRLHKKDAVTRVKALEELSSHAALEETSVESLVACLPVWSHYFNRLAVDGEWKTRVAVHGAHGSLVGKIRKDLAPFLKEIMGAWLLGMNDPFAGVSQAATNAFHKAFTAPKRTDAIAFCKAEIFVFLTNILRLEEATPKPTIAAVPKKRKNVHPAEGNAKAKVTIQTDDGPEPWIVAAALKGLRALIQTVPSPADAFCSEIRNLLAHKQFLKMGKLQTNTIVHPWLQLITVVCLHCPSLIEENAASLSQVLLGTLEHSPTFDLSGCQATWEALLGFFQAFPSFWDHCHPEKAFFPRLNAFLKRGGRGNAAAVYPSLLPLVSLFPKMSEEEWKAFYSSLVEGLSSPGCLASVTESESVLKAIFEVSLFVMRQESVDENLKQHILIDKLIPIVRGVWESPSLAAHQLLVLQEMATIVQKLSSQSSTSSLSTSLWNIVGQDLLFAIRKVGETSVEEDGKLCLEESKLLPFTTFLSLLAERRSIIPQDLLRQFVDESKRILLFHRSLLSLPLLFSLTKFGMDLFLSDSQRITEFLLFAVGENDVKNLVSISAPDLLALLYKFIDCLESPEQREIFRITAVQSLPLVPFFCLLVNSEERSKDIPQEALLSRLQSLLKEHCSERDSETTDRAILGVFRTIYGAEKSAFGDRLLQGVVATLNSMLTETQTTESGIFRLCQIIGSINPGLLIRCPVAEPLSLTLLSLSCSLDEGKSLNATRVAWRQMISEILHSTGGFGILSENEDAGEYVGFFAQALSSLSKHISQPTERYLIILETVLQFLETIKTWECREHEEEMKMDASYRFLKRIAMPLLFEDYCFGDELHPCVLLSLMDRGVCTFSNLQQCDRSALTETEKKLLKGGLLVAGSLLRLNLASESGNEKSDWVVWAVTHVVLASTLTDCLMKAGCADEFLSLCQAKLNEAMIFLENEAPSLKKQVLSRISHASFSKGGLLTLASFHKTSVNVFHLEPPSGDSGSGACSDHSQYLCFSVGEASVCEDFLRTTTASFSKENQSLTDDVIHLLLQWAACLSRLEEDSDDNAPLVVSLAEALKKCREMGDPRFMAEGLPSSHDNSMALPFNLTLMKCFTAILWKNPRPLTAAQWDCILCAAANWLQPFCDIFTITLPPYNCQDLTFCFFFCDLIQRLCVRMKNVIEGFQSASDFQAPSIVKEWEEFFIEHITEHVSKAFFALASVCENQGSFSNLVLHKRLLSKVAVTFSLLYPPRCPEKELQGTFEKLSLLLLHPEPLVQLAANRGIDRLLPAQCRLDQVQAKRVRDAEETEAKMNPSLPPPQWLLDSLYKTQPVVDTLLNDFTEPGHTCIISPSTESYTYTFGYLLVWDLYLSFLSQMDEEVVYIFVEFLRDKAHLSILLSHMMALAHLEDFSDALKSWDFDALTSPKGIQLFAWRVFIRSFEVTPVVVRSWFSLLDKRWNKYVDDLATSFISPLLSDKELTLVQQHGQDHASDIAIRARPAVREVVATYVVDEAQMELVISLPRNYPLAAPMVDAGKRLGVGASQWRQWVVQLAAFLGQQNCRILQGIRLFKRNVDQRFQGVEECYICYSVLHGATRSLPKMACRTCKKKFHSACLYRWFNTSLNASCPLCRNLF